MSGSKRRLLGAAASLPALGLAAVLPAGASPARAPLAGSGYGASRPPEVMGLSLGMQLDAATRVAQGLAPSGSVTLPAMRRDPFIIVAVEAPGALAVPPADTSDPKKDSNFYLLLNSAPRILRNQSTRSSHIDFVTLVATRDERRLVRIVFAPAFVHWSGGFDSARRSPVQLVELLRERYAVEPRLLATPRPKSARGDDAPAGAGGWELRVYSDRRSVVLTDSRLIPDDFASRLQLD